MLGSHLKSRYTRAGALVGVGGLELVRLGGGIIQPGSHLGMRTLVIYHSINTSTDFPQKNRAGALQGLDLAIAAWHDCWGIPTAHILTRIKGALNAAQALVSSPSKDSNVSGAFSLLNSATHLLPLATSRSLERDDQQHILAQLTCLVSLAAAVSLQAGYSPLEAVQLQEVGRSVTNTQLLDYRSDIRSDGTVSGIG